MKRSNILRWLGLLAQCVIGILALWWLITWGKVDVEHLLQRLIHASLLPLTLGILCFVIAIWLRVLQYHLFVAPSVPNTYLAGVTLFQNAVLSFLPWRVGEISYPLLLRRDFNVPIASSASVILTMRLIDLVIILVVATVGSTRLRIQTSWIGIVLAASLLAFAAILALVKWYEHIPDLLQRLVTALKPLREFRQLASLLLLSIAIFSVTSVQSALILQALSFTVAIPDMMILNALTLLAGLLPIHPPGSWGTMDSLQVIILEYLGYSPTIAISAILAAHAFYTLLILIGGIIGWLLRARSLRASKIG